MDIDWKGLVPWYDIQYTLGRIARVRYVRSEEDAEMIGFSAFQVQAVVDCISRRNELIQKDMERYEQGRRSAGVALANRIFGRAV